MKWILILSIALTGCTSAQVEQFRTRVHAAGQAALKTYKKKPSSTTKCKKVGEEIICETYKKPEKSECTRTASGYSCVSR